MHFRPVPMTAPKLYELQTASKVSYPIFQRTSEVWDTEKQRLLIDSMLRGIDIPKLYFYDNEDGTYDCIDGHQRIQALTLFMSNNLRLGDGRRYRDLTPAERQLIDGYVFTITIIKKEDPAAEHNDLRLLFLRLNLGVPINSAERLRAIDSKMGKFVIGLSRLPFVKNTKVTAKRYGKEQLCAQICLNSISRAKYGSFSNSKFEDLSAFYMDYKDFDEDSPDGERINDTLGSLNDIFGSQAKLFRSRANTVSAYLFVEDLAREGPLDQALVRDFFKTFLIELRKEVRRGIHANNETLLNYYSRVIQGADTKRSIDERNEILEEQFEYFKAHRGIQVIPLR